MRVSRFQVILISCSFPVWVADVFLRGWIGREICVFLGFPDVVSGCINLVSGVFLYADVLSLLVFLQMSTRGRSYATYGRPVSAGGILMLLLSETGDGWVAEAVFR